MEYISCKITLKKKKKNYYKYFKFISFIKFVNFKDEGGLIIIYPYISILLSISYHSRSRKNVFISQK